MKTRMWKLWNRYEHMYRVETFAGTPERSEKLRRITLKLNHYFTQL